jgi:hypothetical protein
VGGSFASAGGAPRSNLARIDGSGAVSSWTANANNAVHALLASGSDVFVGGAFGTLGGAPRPSIGAVDAAGSVLAFNPGTSGTVRSLLQIATTVFAAGEFASAGGVPRANVAGFNAESGDVTAFAPDINGAVNALALTTNGSLTAGGAFTTVFGSLVPGVAFFGG